MLDEPENGEKTTNVFHTHNLQLTCTKYYLETVILTIY